MTNIKKLSKRGLALLITLVMCLGLLQLTAFAANEADFEDSEAAEYVDTDTDSGGGTDTMIEEEPDDIQNDVSDENDADIEDNFDVSEDAKDDAANAEDVVLENDAIIEAEPDANVENAETETEAKPVVDSEGEAAEGNGKSDIILAGDDEDVEDEGIQSQDSAIVVTNSIELRNAISNAEDGAVIDVQADIGNYTITMNSEKSITIMSSNGSKIEDDYRVGFSVSKGSLTLKNITINCTSGTLNPNISGGTLTIGTDASITNIGLAVKGGTLVLDGGSISGKAVTVTSGTFEVNSGSVGSVTVSGGTFELNGGHSGIVTVSGGTFNMNGGAINDNNYTLSVNGGGGVMVKSGTFNMSGGEISNNTAKPSYTTASGYGGGVYVSGGTFNMSGGAISNNQALAGGSTKTFGYGGGVYVASGAVFNMSGGTITGNKATSLGGGVYSTGTFTMTGGEISSNTATSGGGVHTTGTFNMTNSTITGNKASSLGGGVYVGGIFNFASGVISGNTKGTADNDVYLSSGKVINVTGALAEDAVIMVELAATAAKTAGTVIVTGKVTEGDAAKFKTNSTTHDLGLSEDGNIVLIVPPAPATYTSADGTDIQEGEFTDMLKKANINGGTVTLQRDVMLDSYAPVYGSNVTLDLNGHTLSRSETEASTYGCVILIYNSASTSLTLKDSVGAGRITGGYGNMGGGIYVLKGCFIMEGGTISGNHANYGGGVYVSSGTTFTMNGGVISGNNAPNGCGVYVNIATFTLNDGEIWNNRAEYGIGACGGGVYAAYSTFTMTGGTIRNNYASEGGAVYLKGSTFTMENGTLTGNESGSYGGSVYVKYYSKSYPGAFTMNGGIIDGSSSVYGGGVYTGRNTTFTMNGGTVSNCKSSDSGGGLYILGTFTMNGGEIIGNYSGVDGGGIMIQNGAVGSIYGGSITNNTADCRVTTATHSTDITIYPYGGGGIYVNGGHAYEVGEDGNELLDDLGNKIASADNGKLYLYNVVITDNHTNVGNAKGYVYGGGIANCPTSHTEVYLANGGAIYGNDASQVFVSSSSGVSHSVFLSGYMLGGGAYNWTDVSGNELANVGELQTLAGSDKVNAYNSLTSEDESVTTANQQAKVYITGNSSTCYGGGIGSNGNVYIGSDLGVLQLTKTVVGETEETEFTFTVTLTVGGEVYTGAVVVNGTEQKPNSAGELTITLKDRETALVTGIPENASYEIVENETDADQIGITVNGETVSEATGTIAKESVGGTSVVFTNTYIEEEPETTSLTVNKIWEGDDEVNRPNSVTVQLYDNGEVSGNPVTLDESNSWTYTWDNLAAEDHEWTVEEVNVPEGYTSNQTTENGVVTITNTYTPDDPEEPPPSNPVYTSLTVNKVWEDEGNEDIRPDSIQVQLYRNGNAYGSLVTLNETNGWSYRWASLIAGVNWTAEEVNVPDGYTSSTTQAGTVVTITNTYVPEEDDEDKDEDEEEEEEEEEDLEDPDVPLTDLPDDPEEEELDDPDVPLGDRPDDLDEDEELDDPDVPLTDLPEIPEEDIPEEDVPQSEVYEEEVSEEEIPEVEIFEEDVPLAEVPKTGDNFSNLWYALTAAAAVGLMALKAVERKKRKED